MKHLSLYLAVFAFLLVLAGGAGTSAAFENITAQEAYDMVCSGKATLIDASMLDEAG